MKESCIFHRRNQTLVIIREDYFELMDGDRSAAATLQVMEYLTNGAISDLLDWDPESEFGPWFQARISKFCDLLLDTWKEHTIRRKIDLICQSGLAQEYQSAKGEIKKYRLNIAMLNELLEGRFSLSSVAKMDTDPVAKMDDGVATGVDDGVDGVYIKEENKEERRENNARTALHNVSAESSDSESQPNSTLDTHGEVFLSHENEPSSLILDKESIIKTVTSWLRRPKNSSKISPREKQSLAESLCNGSWPFDSNVTSVALELFCEDPKWVGAHNRISWFLKWASSNRDRILATSLDRQTNESSQVEVTYPRPVERPAQLQIRNLHQTWNEIVPRKAAPWIGRDEHPDSRSPQFQQNFLAICDKANAILDENPAADINYVWLFRKSGGVFNYTTLMADGFGWLGRRDKKTKHVDVDSIMEAGKEMEKYGTDR